MDAVSEADDSVQLEQDFSEIALSLFSSGTIDGTLQQIVTLAEEAVDGCLAAAILVVDRDDRPRTVASGSKLAADLDQQQVLVDEGPCLDAARSGSTFHAEDLASDDRWPRFAPLALEAGVRSVLAYSMSAKVPSALNLYASLPSAFGATDRAKGQLFATLARLALDTAEAHAAEEFKSAGLNDALRTRELIGQAQGILMERERITAVQAFDLLRRASQHLNIKLRQVAERLVESGEMPGPGHLDPS